MEIGSFLELQLPKGRELYSAEKDIARLNTGRMAIWHAFRVTGCTRIWIPIYQCDSIRETFERKGVEVCFYSQDSHFTPIDIAATESDAVLLVNYYGIMSNSRMADLSKKAGKKRQLLSSLTNCTYSRDYLLTKPQRPCIIILVWDTDLLGEKR